jgi:hypothetical protein
LREDFFVGGTQMGIFIHLDISKSVTKPEWEAVYEETLQLIKHLPLAERVEVDIHGADPQHPKL